MGSVSFVARLVVQCRDKQDSLFSRACGGSKEKLLSVCGSRRLILPKPSLNGNAKECTESPCTYTPTAVTATTRCTSAMQALRVKKREDESEE